MNHSELYCILIAGIVLGTWFTILVIMTAGWF
jgi:hypothetical protein